MDIEDVKTLTRDEVKTLIAEDVFVDNEDPVIERLPFPPGLTGELARSVYNSSNYPHTVISSFVALGCIAGVAGRRFNVRGDGLNVYLTALMDTGLGKSSISKFISRFLNDANIFSGDHTFTGSRNFTGPKALMDLLYLKRCFVSIFTEAGFLVKSKSGDGAGVTRTLLDLYGSSGEHSGMEPESYSSVKDTIPYVKSPCFSMINESTPDIFMEAMSGENATKTGEFTRMTLIHIHEECSELNEDLKYEIHDDLLTIFKSLMAFCSATQCKDESMPIKIKEERVHIAFINKCKRESADCRYSHPIRSRMLSRLGFKTVKIACLISVIDACEEMLANACFSVDRLNWHQINDKEIRISDSAWEWALMLADFEMRGLDKIFDNYNSDPKYLALKDAYLIIVKLFELGGEAPYKGKARLSKHQIAGNIIPRASLRKALAMRASIKSLKSHGPIPEVDIVINYMVKMQYLVPRNSRRGTDYRVTEKLLEDFR